MSLTPIEIDIEQFRVYINVTPPPEQGPMTDPLTVYLNALVMDRNTSLKDSRVISIKESRKLHLWEYSIVMKKTLLAHMAERLIDALIGIKNDPVLYIGGVEGSLVAAQQHNGAIDNIIDNIKKHMLR